MTPFIDPAELHPDGVRLADDGLADSVHVFEQEDVLAINAALGSERPLLVRGEPGTGKSQLARAAAQVLGRAFVTYTVNANTDTRDLLYHVDLVARLAEAQLIAARGASNVKFNVDEALALDTFVSPGPLWWALSPGSASTQQQKARSCHCPVHAPDQAATQGVVVLIDEIDKAQEVVTNGLLDALGDRQFAVPGWKEPVRLDHPMGRPLVVITTNEERTLPNAFIRRCWVRNLALPTDPQELRRFVMQRARAQFPEVVASVLEKAADLLVRDRQALRDQPFPAPGMAEYVDLVRTVTAQRQDPEAQEALLDRVARFAYQKHVRVDGPARPRPSAPEPRS